MPLTKVEYRLAYGSEAYRVGADGSLWTRLTQKGRKGWTSKYLLGNRWRKMKTPPHQRNKILYPVAALHIGGKRLMKRVHSIVLENFVGPRPKGMQALHKNGNPTDNRLENLRWGTPKENAEDTMRHGRTCRGEKNPIAKLTKLQVLEIRQLIARKIRYIDVAKQFGVCLATIGHIARGTNWKYVH